MRSARDSAKLLGVPLPVTPSVLAAWKDSILKPRWRKLAQENHPDRGGDTETFAQLSAAHDSLKALELVDDRIVDEYGATVVGVDRGPSMSDIFEQWARRPSPRPQPRPQHTVVENGHSRTASAPNYDPGHEHVHVDSKGRVHVHVHNRRMPWWVR